MFYDWREYVMSVLGTTNIPSATVLTLGNKVVGLLYCIVFVLYRIVLHCIALHCTYSPSQVPQVGFRVIVLH